MLNISNQLKEMMSGHGNLADNIVTTAMKMISDSSDNNTTSTTYVVKGPKRKNIITRDKELTHESSTKLMNMIYEAKDLDLTGDLPVELEAISNYINTLSTEELNAKNAFGLTDLHAAAYTSNLLIVGELIYKGASINVIDHFYWTPLHYAIYNGNKGHLVTRMLLQKKPLLEISTLDGHRPLDLAIYHDNREAVELLLAHNASVNRHPGENTPLHGAASSSDPEILKMILEKSNNINALNKEGYTALHYAVITKRHDNITLLLKKGADVNIPTPNGFCAIHAALMGKDRNSFYALLAHGADVNAETTQKKRPLCIAIDNHLPDLVKVLLTDAKAEIDYVDMDKLTPLHQAFDILDNEEIVRLLVNHLPKDRKHAIINARDSDQKTPLHRASLFNNAEIINLLLEHGARTDLLDKYEESVIHYAARSGFIENLRLLLNRTKPNILDGKNHAGETPLHLAVGIQQPEMASLLIDKGANVNVITKHRETPLMKAANLNDEKMVELLVNKGALVNPITDRPPLWHAVNHNNENMVRFLLSKDATLTGEIVDRARKHRSLFMIITIDEEAKNLIQYLRLNGMEVSPDLEKTARVLGLDVLKPLTDQLEAREKTKALKKEMKKMKKMAETVPVTAEEEAARLLAEAKRIADEQKWLAQQRKQKEQEEADRKKKAAEELEKKTRLEKEIEKISNEAYDFYAAHSETADLFTPKARKHIIERTGSEQQEPNNAAIAKAMLKILGFGKNKRLPTLVDAYTNHSPQKTPAVEPPAAEPITPQNAAEEPVPETSNEDAERRRIMEQNKTLHRIEKEQATAAKAQQQANAAASSSSSSSAPQIGMKSKEEAYAVRQQVNALADLAEQYLPSSDHASKSLYEMKYDLIKMSALMDCISNAGASLLIKALFADPDEIKVLRNGALHLIEINSERNGYTDDELVLFTCEFYRTILEKLSTLANLRIGLDKGLNTVLKNIQASDLFPLRIQDAFTEMSDSSLAQETYDLFEANHAAWKADPNVNMCSDAKTRIARCHAQITQLRNQEIILSNNDKAMRVIEIAELYRQGANAGVKFYPFPQELIDHKNRFAHNAVDIPPDVIKNVLSQGAGSSSKPKTNEC